MPEQYIPFPIRGIDQFVAYAGSPPDTTPHAINVFPLDSSKSRLRGGSRFGFAKRFTNQLEGTPRSLFSVSKVTSAFNEPYEYLVVLMEDGVYLSEVTRSAGPPVSYTETLTALSGAITDENGESITDEGSNEITSSTIPSTERDGTVIPYQGQILFSQSGNVIVSGVGSVTNGVLTAATISDWVGEGVDVGSHIVNIVRVSGDVVSQSYKIESVAEEELILDGTAVGSGEVTFEVVVGPKLLNPETREVALLTPTGGTIPRGAHVIALYRGRVVWAIDRAWYMSAVGDAGNYNYGADAADASRAVAGVNSDAGEPGDPILALAPVGYDFLVMFGDQSTWVLRGDPAFGGQLVNLSRNVGCVGAKAWCYGHNGEIYFLSKDGVYRLDAAASRPPVSLSDERMPLELKELANDNFDVSMVYDMKQNGVCIFVTPRDGSTGTHWWFDVRTESFWQFQFADDTKQPQAALSFSGAPTRQRSITTLSSDGYVREASGATDDGDDIASLVVLGPFMLSQGLSMEGTLNTVFTEFGINAASMTFDVYTGDSAEQVVVDAIAGATPSFTHTVTAGRNPTVRPRSRGVYACLRISSSGSWSGEAIGIVTINEGERRA